MKYFFDTEFIEDGKTIDLISIGIVSEDGRQLYLQNSKCNFSKASEWVWRNVCPSLKHFSFEKRRRSCKEPQDIVWSGDRCIPRNNDNLCPWVNKKEMAKLIIDFCDVKMYSKPEFWGYYCDYDWVVFCQIFGKMIDLPNDFPMYCKDLKQFCDRIGNPILPKNKNEHNALDDALWNKEVYYFLKKKENIK